jgi:hypothetical protein
MSRIDPKNLTAQLHYRAQGNPPSTHPIDAVGNFFPGLEFNFQNVWKRILIGLELLEYGGQVIAVNEAELSSMDAAQLTSLKSVVGGFLANVDGQELVSNIRGPAQVGAQPEVLGQIYLEWSNALAKIHAEKGGTEQTVACTFVVTEASAGNCMCDVRKGPFHLKVRRLIVPGTALISREANEPGEITESLCSPWQTDYIGCACYYWAANRPDYVNIEPVRDAQGKDTAVSTGHNWLNLARNSDQDGNPVYTLRPQQVLTHEDVMRGWEDKFQFIVGSRDILNGIAETGTAATPKPKSRA